MNVKKGDLGESSIDGTEGLIVMGVKKEIWYWFWDKPRGSTDDLVVHILRCEEGVCVFLFCGGVQGGSLCMLWHAMRLIVFQPMCLLEGKHRSDRIKMDIKLFTISMKLSWLFSWILWASVVGGAVAIGWHDVRTGLIKNTALAWWSFVLMTAVVWQGWPVQWVSITASLVLVGVLAYVPRKTLWGGGDGKLLCAGSMACSLEQWAWWLMIAGAGAYLVLVWARWRWVPFGPFLMAGWLGVQAWPWILTVILH